MLPGLIRQSLFFTSFLLLIDVKQALAQEKPTFLISGSGGFRRVQDVNDENDYSMEVFANNQWRVNLFRSGRRFYGKLDMKAFSELEKLFQTAQQADRSSLADPRIADLPSLLITDRPGVQGKPSESHRIKLRIGSTPAKAIHDWVVGIRAISNSGVIGHYQFGEIGAPGKMVEEALESKQAIQKRLGKESAKELDGVDFKKQKVVLIAWRGSGGDRLESKLITAGMKQTLQLKRVGGRIKNLASHCHVLVMPASVEYEFGGGF